MPRSTKCSTCDGKGYVNRRANGAVGGWERLICPNPECTHRIEPTKIAYITRNLKAEQVVAVYRQGMWLYDGDRVFDTPEHAVSHKISTILQEVRRATDALEYWARYRYWMDHPNMPTKCQFGHPLEYLSTRFARCAACGNGQDNYFAYFEITADGTMWESPKLYAEKMLDLDRRLLIMDAVRKDV